MEDEVVQRTRYVPAWSFADAAQRWAALSAAPGPDDYQPEAPHLTLLYSALALEALIMQELDSASLPLQVADLMENRISILRRWREGSTRLAGNAADAIAAANSISRECQERGRFGLLVRARNKLVHPRIHVEVFDALGHGIQDGPVEALVQDLRAAPTNLPVTRPAFPNIIQCKAAAEWSRGVLGHMTRLLFRVVQRPVDDQWERVLP